VTQVPAEKRNTAMVFQIYALWPHMTVYQNVEFGPRMRGVARRKRRQRAEEHLRRVELSAFGLRRPNQLSGGQQQRVALARALAAGADCLLLDEPLSNLDARLRTAMRSELRRLVKGSGATGVYVTHDQKEALSMADRIALMRDGRIVQIGKPEEIYTRPASRFVADFIGEANFLPGRVARAGQPAEIDTPAGALLADGVGLEAGTDVTVCVRPERIDIAPAEMNAATQPPPLAAEVRSSTYLGEIRQYGCVLRDGTTWRISTLGEHRARLEAGRAVFLRIEPQDARVLTE